MNEQEQQLQQITLHIDEAKKAVAMGKVLDRLYKNPDFKEVILDYYFVTEASRTVLLKADPNMRGEAEQNDCENIIIGIGMLRQFFAKVFHMADQAQQAILESENAREEILEEQLLEEDTLQ